MDTIISISKENNSKFILSSNIPLNNSELNFVEVECEKDMGIDKVLEDIANELLNEIEDHSELDTEEKKINYIIRRAALEGKKRL